MKRYLRGCLVLIFSICSIIILLPDRAFSESCTNWVAKAVSVQGNVEVQKSGESQWQVVNLHSTFCGIFEYLSR